VVSKRLDIMIEESGLDSFESEDLAAFLTMLESLVDESVPEPSPALAAMLSGGAAEAGVSSLAARRHQNALAAAALALTGIVATGVAAAANDLPPAVQRVVAEFSQSFLPFGFPYPEKMSENLTGQTDRTLEGSYDPDRWGGRGEGITDGEGMDDGEAPTGAQDVGGDPQSVVDSSDRGDADDDSGSNPESQDDEQESGTQTNAGEGDGHEDSGSGDSDESSSGETDDLETTAGDGSSESEDLDDSSADTSGEGGGDRPDYEDGTRDSTEAIDD